MNISTHLAPRTTNHLAPLMPFIYLAIVLILTLIALWSFETTAVFHSGTNSGEATSVAPTNREILPAIEIQMFTVNSPAPPYIIVD